MKKKLNLNALQAAQLKDSMKAGMQLNLKVSRETKRSIYDTPLFSETVQQTKLF